MTWRHGTPRTPRGDTARTRRARRRAPATTRTRRRNRRRGGFRDARFGRRARVHHRHRQPRRGFGVLCIMTRVRSPRSLASPKGVSPPSVPSVADAAVRDVWRNPDGARFGRVSRGRNGAGELFSSADGSRQREERADDPCMAEPRRTRGGSAVLDQTSGPRPTRILVARRPGSRPGRAPRGARGQPRWGSCSRRTSGSARSPRASWDDAPRPSGRELRATAERLRRRSRGASRPRGGKRRGGGVKTPRRRDRLRGRLHLGARGRTRSTAAVDPRGAAQWTHAPRRENTDRRGRHVKMWIHRSNAQRAPSRSTPEPYIQSCRLSPRRGAASPSRRFYEPRSTPNHRARSSPSASSPNDDHLRSPSRAVFAPDDFAAHRRATGSPATRLKRLRTHQPPRATRHVLLREGVREDVTTTGIADFARLDSTDEPAENGRWKDDEERRGGRRRGGVDTAAATRMAATAKSREAGRGGGDARPEGATVEEEGKEVNADADVGWVSFGRVREARIFLPTAAGSRPSRSDG